jgi:hypothetical protein
MRSGRDGKEKNFLHCPCSEGNFTSKIIFCVIVGTLMKCFNFAIYIVILCLCSVIPIAGRPLTC